MFSAHGRKPTNLDEANEREKDIRYSSRTMLTTDTLREKHCVRHAINELHKLLPPGLANTEQAKRLYEHGCVTVMDIVQLIYRPIEPQGALKDLEFSRSTMESRWQQGFSDSRIHAGPCRPLLGSRQCRQRSACESSTLPGAVSTKIAGRRPKMRWENHSGCITRRAHSIQKRERWPRDAFEQGPFGLRARENSNSK